MSLKLKLSLCALGTFAALGMTPRANAFTYTAGSMTKWSSCDQACRGSSPLEYTDDEISMFIGAMKDGDHERNVWNHNQGMLVSPLVEDLFGGQDNLYTDRFPLFIFAGHGEAPIDPAGRQWFRAPLCHGGPNSGCHWQSNTTCMGERSGLFASPSPGNLRWMILRTCYSVHTKPNEQWREMLRYGGDVIFGYRGLMADHWATDEVPEDFAEEAFVGKDKLKAAWFWAVEDWYIDDVGSLVASGVDRTDAKFRRDNLRRTSAMRGTAEHSRFAWSWHEG